MNFGHFWCVKVLLESSFKSVALDKSILCSFSGHLNYLFHKKFLFSSSKPNSCPKQCFSRINEPNHSAVPRSLVQKVSVQCILGTVYTGCLLSAFDHSRGINTSKRASTYIALPRYGIYCYFSLFELIIKPAALLVEDPRSKASSKNNNPQTTAMFIDIGYDIIFLILSYIIFLILVYLPKFKIQTSISVLLGKTSFTIGWWTKHWWPNHGLTI